MNLRQRLLQFLFGISHDRDRQRQAARRRLAEPRGRVRASRFGCSVCRGEFASFALLKAHVCHAMQSAPSIGDRPRFIVEADRGEQISEGGAR